MTLVFFHPNMLRNAHRSIFDLDRLEEEGFKTIFLDGSPYNGYGSWVNDEKILERRVVCSTNEDFKAFNKNLPQEPVLFITYDNYMKFAAPILNMIIRKQDVLLSYHTKRLSSVVNPRGIGRLIFNKIISFFDNFLPLHYFSFYYRIKHKMYIPDYFLCSTKYLIPTKVFFTIKRENRIVVHADDMNETLRADKSVVSKEKRFGVFIDQGLPFIGKTHALAYKDGNPFPEDYLDEYYIKLENALQRLKEVFQLDEIVISLHPVALRFEKELEGKFSNFRTFMGSTKDLVRDSQIVFGHYSTALSFAVIYNKPVITLTDKVILNFDPIIREHILFFQNDLGMRNYDMDKEEDISSEEILIDKKKYFYYTKNFLKDNAIQENSYYHAINTISGRMKNNQKNSVL